MIRTLISIACLLTGSLGLDQLPVTRSKMAAVIPGVLDICKGQFENNTALSLSRVAVFTSILGGTNCQTPMSNKMVEMNATFAGWKCKGTTLTDNNGHVRLTVVLPKTSSEPRILRLCLNQSNCVDHVFPLMSKAFKSLDPITNSPDHIENSLNRINNSSRLLFDDVAVQICVKQDTVERSGVGNSSGRIARSVGQRSSHSTSGTKVAVTGKWNGNEKKRMGDEENEWDRIPMEWMKKNKPRRGNGPHSKHGKKWNIKKTRFARDMSRMEDIEALNLLKKSGSSPFLASMEGEKWQNKIEPSETIMGTEVKGAYENRHGKEGVLSNNRECPGGKIWNDSGIMGVKLNWDKKFDDSGMSWIKRTADKRWDDSGMAWMKRNPDKKWDDSGMAWMKRNLDKKWDDSGMAWMKRNPDKKWDDSGMAWMKRNPDKKWDDSGMAWMKRNPDKKWDDSGIAWMKRNPDKKWDDSGMAWMKRNMDKKWDDSGMAWIKKSEENFGSNLANENRNSGNDQSNRPVEHSNSADDILSHLMRSASSELRSRHLSGHLKPHNRK